MPFIHSITYFPSAIGLEEFRELVEQRVRVLQASGVDANLSATEWDPDYPTYRIGQRYTLLADYERYRAPHISAARQFEARVAPLMRRMPTLALAESLQRTNQSGPDQWSQWVLIAPALGQGLQLRELLVERGNYYEAVGRRTTLSVQVAGPEPGVFVRTFGYATLAEVEEWRKQGATDEAGVDFVTKVNALVSRPLETTIRETLIPYPQSS